jgi:hypothetical protein
MKLFLCPCACLIRKKAINGIAFHFGNRNISTIGLLAPMVIRWHSKSSGAVNRARSGPTEMPPACAATFFPLKFGYFQVFS